MKTNTEMHSDILKCVILIFVTRCHISVEVQCTLVLDYKKIVFFHVCYIYVGSKF